MSTTSGEQHPPEQVDTPESARAFVYDAFAVLAIHPVRQFAITLCAEMSAPTTYREIADRLNSGFLQPGFHVTDTLVRSFMRLSLASMFETEDRVGLPPLTTLTAHAKEYAAAAAGVLYKTQIANPLTPLTTAFSSVRPGGTAARMLILKTLAKQEHGYTPTKTIWEESGRDPTLYALLDKLAAAGVIEQKPLERRYFLRVPEKRRRHTIPEAGLLNAAALSLVDEGVTEASASELVQQVAFMFPDVDVQTIVRYMATTSLPHSMTPTPETSGKQGRFVARITRAYQNPIRQLIAGLEAIAKSKTERDQARDYARRLFIDKPHLVSFILSINQPEPTSELQSTGIPAPWYEGWRADGRPPTLWRPSFPQRLGAATLAEVPTVDAIIRYPNTITNTALSQYFEDLANRTRR